MALAQRSTLIGHLRRAVLLRDGGGLTDGELLGEFLGRRDEAAFEALVRRHGPMVLGVCRRVLGNSHDAEDAFQATFLVLAQRAGSIVPRGMVGNWLYGVAHRTALQARRAAGRRERLLANSPLRVIDMPHPRVEEEENWRELLPLLDRELDRLPAKYRAAVVLCHLEGRTRKEAARQLGLPVGTLSGRLTTGMRMLAKRLGRHGLEISGGVLLAALSSKVASASVTPSLMASTVNAATLVGTGQAAIASVVSAPVVALTKGVMKSMLLAKLKLAMAVLLVVGAVGSGTGVYAYRPHAHESPPIAIGGLEPDSRARTSDPALEQSDKKSNALMADKQRLQGSWGPIAGLVHGEKKDPADFKQWKLIFDGDMVTIPEYRTVRYTLDPKKQPKEMDIMGKNDIPDLLAIYELEGDKLKFSFRKAGGRPVDFDTLKNESVLIVFAKQRRNKSND
jgi:RNA polymerase sigma-70 factor (ECF subfamily)